jgi:ABC-type branched-subunit amino acid transport system substrate-binding protein
MLMSLLLFALTGCSVPGSVRTVVKIGLVAPFEGSQRTLAYDALFGSRLAVQRHNRTASQEQPLVELVALNDDGRPAESQHQAREMAIDPDIVGVIGPWSTETAQAALDAYRTARLAVVLPDANLLPKREPASPDLADGVAEIATGALVADKEFAARFQAMAGREPSRQAIAAYDAANLLLNAMVERPTRAGVFAQITASSHGKTR